MDSASDHGSSSSSTLVSSSSNSSSSSALINSSSSSTGASSSTGESDQRFISLARTVTTTAAPGASVPVVRPLLWQEEGEGAERGGAAVDKGDADDDVSNQAHLGGGRLEMQKGTGGGVGGGGGHAASKDG